MRNLNPKGVRVNKPQREYVRLFISNTKAGVVINGEPHIIVDANPSIRDEASVILMTPEEALHHIDMCYTAIDHNRGITFTFVNGSQNFNV